MKKLHLVKVGAVKIRVCYFLGPVWKTKSWNNSKPTC